MPSDYLALVLILELDLNGFTFYFCGITLLVAVFLVFILRNLINKEFGRINNAINGVISSDVLVTLPSIRVVMWNRRANKIIIIKIIDSHTPFTQAGTNFSL